MRFQLAGAHGHKSPKIISAFHPQLLSDGQTEETNEISKLSSVLTTEADSSELRDGVSSTRQKRSVSETEHQTTESLDTETPAQCRFLTIGGFRQLSSAENWSFDPPAYADATSARYSNGHTLWGAL